MKEWKSGRNGGQKMRENRKWEERKNLIFSYLCLIEMMEKWKDRKLICLVEKKNERMEK